VPDRIPPPPSSGVPDPSFWARPPDAPPFGGGPRDPMRPALDRSWTDAITDRVRTWRADVRLGAVALVLVALAAGFLWYRMGLSSGDDAAAARETTPPESAAPADTASTTTVPTEVVVHVAGAVAEPGVVELRPDARVIDAVEAVGGARPEADLDRLNLAAKLVDGQRVLVQRVGDPPAPPDPAGTEPDDAATPGDASSAPGAPIDLNTATTAQLEELPGIGPVLAQAIIDERTRRGGFDSVNELLDVSGIGDARFADIEALVTV
jgi:competence protein ComEA